MGYGSVGEGLRRDLVPWGGLGVCGNLETLAGPRAQVKLATAL